MRSLQKTLAVFLVFAASSEPAFGGARGVHAASVREYYGDFEAPVFENATFEQVRRLLLEGRPFVVTDGARDLPMTKWDCDFVKREFPDSRIRHEGGKSEINGILMSSDWTNLSEPFEGASKFPPGAPRLRPFYWDIAKALDERHRQWGKNPERVAEKIAASASVPYWLPPQDARFLGSSSEMWFHPPGAGAPAHMDPHCQTTVSFCFSGTRRWRMMLPPEEPHRNGYFDGEVYGVRDTSRRGEWKPTFEFEAPAGSAVVVYPGMVHETVSTGDTCSSSVSQTFASPIAAAYYRAFWPRFSLIHEDVGRCSHVVEGLVNLGSATKVKPASEKVARKVGGAFAETVDADGDGTVSRAELVAVSGGRRGLVGRNFDEDELVSFHDVDRDGMVTTAEIADSWVMYATTMKQLSERRKSGEL